MDKDIKEYVELKALFDLRSFLGRYYGNIFEDYASIANLLSSILNGKNDLVSKHPCL